MPAPVRMDGPSAGNHRLVHPQRRPSMSHASTARTDARDNRRTPAQWYCLLGGAALLLAGILGFLADSSFDTGDNVQGDSFLGFEVNAIHNIVHIASGLLLLAAFPRRSSARA